MITGIFILLTTVMFACKSIDYSEISGSYQLQSATLEGMDITDEYFAYQLTLNEDQTMTVFINYLNIIENRNSTYTYKNNVITESHQSGTFKYLVNEDKTELSFSEEVLGETLVIVLVKIDEHQNGVQGVDFDSILFGDDINDTKRFNYAPTVIIEVVDGIKTMHIWYCMNRLSGIIVDHIGYRKGVLNDDDLWEFEEEVIALAPTPGTWDSRHVCDPTVIKGDFSYDGEVYSYMMSYLGCTTDDYSNNETGLALAKNPEGPWIKMDHLNPIVPWDRDNQSGMWGTGMPTLLSIDQKGEVLLFYSNSIFGVSVDHYDFSNMDEPVLKFTRNIESTGLTNPNGTRLTYVGLADFGYDPVKKRLYMSSYTNTKNPPDITMTRVNSHGAVHYIENIDSLEDVVEVIKNGGYEWILLDFIGPEDTGFPRNHNLGLVRDAFGIIYDSEHIMVVFSTGQNDYPNENIFTYRLHGIKLPS